MECLSKCGDPMKFWVLMLLLAVCSCNSKDSNSSKPGGEKKPPTVAERKCMVTQNAAKELIGHYASVEDAETQLIRWADKLSVQGQGCNVDLNALEKALDQNLIINCAQDNSCVVKNKEQGKI